MNKTNWPSDLVQRHFLAFHGVDNNLLEFVSDEILGCISSSIKLCMVSIHRERVVCLTLNRSWKSSLPDTSCKVFPHTRSPSCIEWTESWWSQIFRVLPSETSGNKFAKVNYSLIKGWMGEAVNRGRVDPCEACRGVI